jgi:hypothetical protein
MAAKASKAKTAVTEVNLIVDEIPAAAPNVDRWASRQDVGFPNPFRAKKVAKSLSSMQEDVDKISAMVTQLAEGFTAKSATKGNSFSITEIEVALAISGEGSIGIATAGIEASFTLTLSRSG